MLEALEKLREIAEKLDDAAARMSEHGFSPIAVKTSLLCDEIEAEIADRYMLLPVDADGVPIHVGDTMTLAHGKSCEVVAVSETQFTANKLGSPKVVCHANLHRHAKPRTLEVALFEFGELVANSASHPCNEDVRKYADEIRELMGGDAE